MQALISLRCHFMGLLAILNLACGAIYAADPVDVRDMKLQEFSQNSRGFESWVRDQQRTYPQTGPQLTDVLAHRKSVQSSDYWRESTQLQRLMSRKTEVPSPDTFGSVRPPVVQIPLKGPLDVLSPLPDLSIGMQPLEDPRVKFSGKLQGGVLFAKKVMAVTCVLADDKAVWQTQNEFKADVPEWGEDLLTLPMDHLPLKISLSNGQLDEAAGGMDVGIASADLRVMPMPEHGDKALKTSASASVGAGTPGLFKHVAFARVEVGAEVSVLAELTDPVYGTPYGRQTLNGALVKHIQAAMLNVFTCPRCEGLGEQTCDTCDNEHTITCPVCEDIGTITCLTCSDRRRVPCPSCRGERHYICNTCNDGWLPCETTQQCSTCRGTGWDDCLWCSGVGSTEKEHSETRWHFVTRRLGFDDNGVPIEEHYKVPYTHEWSETVPCSSCGARGGETCSRCNNGTVQCSTCDGEGQKRCSVCDGDGLVDCRKCRGSGEITCRKCRGKPIRCPKCKGRALRCPACKGKPLRCAYCRGRKSWGGRTP